MKAFAAEIKARRGALGLNQEQLARICPLNRTFIAKLELGQTSPSLTTLFRLAVGLEVDPEDLIVSTKKRYRKELRSAIEK
ncbi:helix-turn-helix domain-containing protein [Variovorax sp. dw_308]|uniref:helix-turn-helix domain-containing protein n=1 Tax=Variovorax sp. dw_308 TaxID=2721546 RepID=UPI002108D375|nr:helix-turn-helix transcriptional regulator [Variovorax sp. dw_308]